MEDSLPWGGTVIGDAGPYNDDEWSDTWRKLYMRHRLFEAVLDGYGSMLEVTGVASPIGVADGAALVDGKWYENTAALAVVVPTPAVDTRIDRIVLRKSWAAQTVRVTRIPGIEGGGAPAVTQIDGVTWDISLAQVSITILGVITVTDERAFVRSPLAMWNAPGGGTKTISAGAISVSDRRSHYLVDTQGGAATDDLDTISGGIEDGQVIVLGIVSAAREVVVTSAGNVGMPAGNEIVLGDIHAYVALRWNLLSNKWQVIGGSFLSVVTLRWILGDGAQEVQVGWLAFDKAPFSVDVEAWELLADRVGSIVIDVWQKNAFPPADADAMPGAGNEPTIAAAQSASGTTAAWTAKRIVRGYYLGLNCDSSDTIEQVTLCLTGRPVWE